MTFEGFLRSIPLVHKHIMRTRRLMHENRKFTHFLEKNGIKPSEILADTGVEFNLAAETQKIAPGDYKNTLNTIAVSLRAEQIRAANLEADLYVLQIDYDDLMKRTAALTDINGCSPDDTNGKTN